MWKKILIGFLVLAAIGGVMDLFGLNEGHEDKIAKETQEYQRQSIEKEAEKAAELNKVNITAEAQDMVNEKGERKVVVWLTNASSKSFSGTIKVNSLDIDGTSLDYGSLNPENVEPGKKAYGILWMKTSSSAPNFKTQILSGEFK